MKQERPQDQQVHDQKAERLFAKVARFAHQHGAHLTRKDHDTSWYAPHTGELCIGSRLSSQEAVERIVYETAMLLNNINHTLPLAERLTFEQKRLIAAATTSNVMGRHAPWKRGAPLANREIQKYYEDYLYTFQPAEYDRVLETTNRIREALAGAKRLRFSRKKPKLARLNRSWDPVMTVGGSLIRVQKPGVKEWPSTQVTMTTRGYFTLVYEALGHYRQD